MIELENNTRQEITGVAIRLIQTKAYKAKGIIEHKQTTILFIHYKFTIY